MLVDKVCKQHWTHGQRLRLQLIDYSVVCYIVCFNSRTMTATLSGVVMKSGTEQGTYSDMEWRSQITGEELANSDCLPLTGILHLTNLDYHYYLLWSPGTAKLLVLSITCHSVNWVHLVCFCELKMTISLDPIKDPGEAHSGHSLALWTLGSLRIKPLFKALGQWSLKFRYM